MAMTFTTEIKAKAFDLSVQIARKRYLCLTPAPTS